MRRGALVSVALLVAAGLFLLLLGNGRAVAGETASPAPQPSGAWPSLPSLVSRSPDPPVLLRLWLRPDRVDVGGSTSVDLLIENADDLYGVDLVVTFDPAAVAAQDLAPGQLLPNPHVVEQEVDNSTGTIRYVATLLGDAAAAASTGGVASFNLTARSQGTARLGWDVSRVKLSDRESNPLPWEAQEALLEVVGPTATPTVPPTSGDNAPPPKATHTPVPTATATPTRPPAATPTPTSPATPAPSPTGGPVPYSTPSAAGWDPTFSEPTLGPVGGVVLRSELPAGIPTVTGGGVVALLEPTPGVGVVRSAVGGADVEVRVDNQGGSVALRFQPLPAPPAGVTLPEGTEVARVFALDLYAYDAVDDSTRRIVYSEGRSSAPIVLNWALSEADLRPTLDEAGNPHPERLVFYRISPEGQLVKIATRWKPEPAPRGTLTAVFVDRSTFLLVALPRGQEGQTMPADERYFPETGFRVGRDAFWDYFTRRGGVGTFGYPVSREFSLMGFPVQLFQRGLLQAQPDGGVSTMNLLDAGLMPFTQINFSSFPESDLALIQSAPAVDDPDYAERAIEFLRDQLPEKWEGMPVGFYRRFVATVSLEEAFSEGQGDPALVPLLNLEVWGFPTSRPAQDPNNHNFVYQRFQRGIMHYNATSGATEGVLLGDYLKSLMTGRNLPADLEREARDSPLYRQYDRGKPGHVARGQDLHGTNLVGAFEMDVPRETVGTEARGGVPPE